MTDRRCATCGEAHVYGQDGWYADNGKGRHPYKQAGEAEAKPEAGELGKRYRRTGVATALLLECVDCWPTFVVLNQRGSLAEHDAFHEGRRRT